MQTQVLCESGRRAAAEGGGIQPPPSSIYDMLQLAQRSMTRRAAGRLAACGITPGEYNILRVLRGREKITPANLSEALGYTSSAVSNYLRQLQEKGVVSRRPLRKDRRQRRVDLTIRGSCLGSEAAAAVREAADEALRGIPAGDLEVLFQCLSCLCSRNQAPT